MASSGRIGPGGAPWRRLLVVAAVGLSAWALLGCSEADTLGDEPPTEVQVGTPPTWSNGVGDLMQLKCAVCHQVPLPPISPNNTPTTFDLNYPQVSPGGLPGAVSIIPSIQAGILRGPLGAISRMPLEYATPLTEQETLALEAWNGAL